MKKKRSKKSAFKISRKAGASPGTLVYTGSATGIRPTITVCSYSPENSVCTSGTVLSPPPSSPDTVQWVDIDALHDITLIEQAGARFGLHPLVLEDILNTEQLPKEEEFDTYLYLTLKILYVAEDEIEQEHVNLVLGDSWLLSFREKPDGIFAPVRQRIDAGKGRLRKRGADYLLFALVDVIVDNYYHVTEYLAETIELIETELIDTPTSETVAKIFACRTRLMQVKKVLYPLRDTLRKLASEESELIEERTLKYFADVHDHVNNLIATVEMQRETLSGLMELYMSTISNHMNTVMKTLTVIATIFIPLTFVAGVYGMNFKNMPELEWQWGYPIILALMLLMGGGMYVYMRKKRWF